MHGDDALQVQAHPALLPRGSWLGEGDCPWSGLQAAAGRSYRAGSSKFWGGGACGAWVSSSSSGLICQQGFPHSEMVGA